MSFISNDAGGVDSAAVGQALSRFNRRLQQDRALGRNVAQIEHELSKIDSAEKLACT